MTLIHKESGVKMEVRISKINSHSSSQILKFISGIFVTIVSSNLILSLSQSLSLSLSLSVCLPPSLSLYLSLSLSSLSQVQIRSQRMHWEAEYGAAAHTKYKALLLPEVSTARD